MAVVPSARDAQPRHQEPVKAIPCVLKGGAALLLSEPHVQPCVSKSESAGMKRLCAIGVIAAPVAPDEMITVTVMFVCCERLSSTPIVYSYVPAVVGSPETTPVEPLSVSPGGREPLEMIQLTG